MQITLPAKLEWWWNSNWNAADYQTAVDASYAIYNATLWLFHKQNAFTWDWKERASQWFFGLLNIPSRYWQWYSWNAIKSRWLVTQYGDLKANVYTYKFNNTINSLNGQIYWSVRRSNGYSYVTYWDTNWAEYIDSNQNINTIPDPSWNHVRWNRWVKVATGTKHYLVGAEVSTAGTVASNIIAFECNENWAIINTTRIVIYTSFLYSFYSWTRWWVVTADVPICAVWNTIYTWTVCVVRHTNNTSYSPDWQYTYSELKAIYGADELNKIWQYKQQLLQQWYTPSKVITDPEKLFAFETKLKKEFDNANEWNQASVTQINKMNQALAKIDKNQSWSKLYNNAASQTIIMAFNKLLDPNSVVRESEYARTPEWVSLIHRIEWKLEQIANWWAWLTYADLKAIVDMANEFGEWYKKNLIESAQMYKWYADMYWLTLENILPISIIKQLDATNKNSNFKYDWWNPFGSTTTTWNRTF